MINPMGTVDVNQQMSTGDKMKKRLRRTEADCRPAEKSDVCRPIKEADQDEATLAPLTFSLSEALLMPLLDDEENLFERN